MQAAAIAAACALLVGAASVPLLVTPALRLAEAADSGASKERHEQASTTGRFEQLRQLRIEHRRASFILSSSTRSLSGGAQHASPFAPRGHRLANGLLAPRRC